MNEPLPPLPRIDPDNARFWEGTRNHRLEVQRCTECQTLRYYARELCPKCWSDGVEWVELSGRGSVYSWSVVRMAPVPALADAVPYVVGLIDLEEGVRIFSRLRGAGEDDVEIGAAVTVAYEQINEEVTLPLFELAAEGGRA